MIPSPNIAVLRSELASAVVAVAAFGTVAAAAEAAGIAEDLVVDRWKGRRPGLRGWGLGPKAA